MLKYKIWSEGYSVTGSSGGAHFEGEYEADNFYDACVKLLGNKLDKDRNGNYRLSIWGCRLFDNEVDARTSFG